MGAATPGHMPTSGLDVCATSLVCRPGRLGDPTPTLSLVATLEVMTDTLRVPQTVKHLKKGGREESPLHLVG